jgi:sulfate adenylyltransferase (ADP) / ATP adenylyltransferase
VNKATTGRIPWESSSLFSKLKAQHNYALSTGALQPIETQVERLQVGDIEFVVRVLANLSRKEKALQQQGKTAPANPFLPYEQALYVSDISDTHLCLLNKFNVVDYHFLMVTRQFESQDSWLTLADFEALVRCLQAVDGLAFFNGGTVAGSSQPHKHLQVVPYTEALTAFPMEWVITASEGLALADVASKDSASENSASKDSALEEVSTNDAKGEPKVIASRRLPFRHAILRGLSDKPTAQHYLAYYHSLLKAVGIKGFAKGTSPQGEAYNLLCNRQWMMVVPRIQEKYDNISVNALGFAGSLLVRDQEMLAKLQTIGPMKLLQHVGYPSIPPAL